MYSSKITASLLVALAASASVQAAPAKNVGKRCVATATTFDDLAAAVSGGCLSLSIGPFSVPSGKLLDLTGLADGTTVTVAGDIDFESGVDWAGPMFQIEGSDITFDGGGFTFNGNGQDYWDGEGSNGGVTKPKMMKIKNGGTFSNLVILNSPVHTFSIGNSEALVIDGITINNKAGDTGGGHNTDGFDISASGVTVQNCFIYNQDDCFAINAGSNINIKSNYCSGGHGISIGSIQSDKVVDTVTISGNTVVNSDNGLRIKTVSGATGGSVSSVTYDGNCVSGIRKAGNGSPTGTPTNGIPITDVSFTGSNTVAVEDGADEVYVLCGDGSCKGTWDWSGLSVSGGDAGSITGSPPITGFTLA